MLAAGSRAVLQVLHAPAVGIEHVTDMPECNI